MLKIKTNVNNIESLNIDNVQFISEDDINYFLLTTSQLDEISIQVNFPFPVHTTYTYEDVVVHPFFSNKYFKESNIFELHERSLEDSRIGWIFPVQALSSLDHQYADNEHLLRYFYVAYQRLLRGSFFDNDYEIIIASNQVTLSINEIYPSDLIVLALSTNKTDLIDNFSIKNYYHSLYINSYFFCSKTSQISLLARIEIPPVIFTRIYIDPISKFLKDEIYLQALFKTHLITTNHPLVKFHFLYQIIELLIEKILDIEVSKILAIAAAKSMSPHDIKKLFNDVAAEHFRITQLFNVFINATPPTSQELITECNVILSEYKTAKEDVVGAFYQLRNLVVHNFRKITDVDPHFGQLANINCEFEKVLVDVLSKYNEPTLVIPLQEEAQSIIEQVLPEASN